MAKYIAVLSKKAQKQLDNISDNIAEPVICALEMMASMGVKKLSLLISVLLIKQ